jgi:hypothetical protein
MISGSWGCSYGSSILEQIELPGGHVMGCPFLGEHADLNVRTKLAYYVDLHSSKIMMAAEICFNCDMRLITTYSSIGFAQKVGGLHKKSLLLILLAFER